ncbi:MULTISPECIES: hypothetical protein [Thermodesulfovibrio]|jgi:hypothetical protein|uniref:hypothetical protein n=1 Tax=Thermodesulfovibrio TaxID=28261 RepID=UPI002629E2A9|nr:hypothetical protein [Thermodesulfovibrio sp.]
MKRYWINEATAELDRAATALELSVTLDYAITALVMLVVVYVFFLIYQNEIQNT